jgi:hypothetical protein
MKINRLTLNVAYVAIGALGALAIQMVATDLNKPRTDKWYFLYNTQASIMGKNDSGPYDSEDACLAAEEKANKQGARVMGCRQQ